MRPTIAAAALVGSVAANGPLATVTPCPTGISWPKSVYVPPITVTEQYQPISTCLPSKVCNGGKCTTTYPFSTTTWLSTTVPCAFDGTSSSSTVITETDMAVTVSEWISTETNYVTSTITKVWGTKTMSWPTSSAVYTTTKKDWYVPYHAVGPLAFPGYAGSGLCEECQLKPDGSKSQVLNVTECSKGPLDSSPKCWEFEETWVSKPAPSTTTPVSAACSTSWYAPSAGTYTWTFPQTAPACEITAGPKTWSADPKPWWAYVTKTCDGPQWFDFETTVTKTITIHVPLFTPSCTKSWSAPAPTDPNWPMSVPAVPTGWGVWDPKTKTTTTAWAPSSTSTGGWADGDTSSTSSSYSWSSSSDSAFSTSSYSFSTSSFSFSTPTSFSFSFSTPTSSFSFSQPTSSFSFSTPTSSFSFSTPTSSFSFSTTSSFGPYSTTSLGYSTSFSTSSFATTTTSAAAAPPVDASTGVYFEVTDGSSKRFRKRGTRYLAFNGDDGYLVNSKAEASIFNFIADELISESEFVGADASSGFTPFQKFHTRNAYTSGWAFGGGSISYQNANFPGDATFCFKPDGSFFIVLSSSPADCTPAVVAPIACNPTSTTSTSISTTTTSTSISTTPASTSISTTTRATTTSAPTTTHYFPSTTTSFAHPDPSSEPDPEPETPKEFKRTIAKRGRRSLREIIAEDEE